jgi:hypothetical protein
MLNGRGKIKLVDENSLCRYYKAYVLYYIILQKKMGERRRINLEISTDEDDNCIRKKNLSLLTLEAPRVVWTRFQK